jgi:hypothetical protein
MILKSVQDIHSGEEADVPERTWPRPLPAGVCWCGCGTEVDARAFFVRGHDKRAEAGVIRREYGSVVDFLAAHGYGPTRKSTVEGGDDA